MAGRESGRCDDMDRGRRAERKGSVQKERLRRDKRNEWRQRMSKERAREI